MADMIAVLNAILFATGISEVFLALGIIACGIAQIFLYSRLHPIGHCIWTGIFFLAAAALAIIAAITRKRAFCVVHVFAAILSCLCIVPCLIGLLVIELISDSWFSFWSDPSWCQGGCYASGDKYIRVNYGSLWSVVYKNDLASLCSGTKWRRNCHPNSDAVVIEILGIVLAAVLALFFLGSIMLCAICVRYTSSRDTVHPKDGDQPDKGPARYVTAMQAHPSNHNLYTSWNIPQYNTVHDSPPDLPIYAVVNSKQASNPAIYDEVQFKTKR